MTGADHVTEITGVKVSPEPLLDFLKDPKAESKAQLAADSAKKHFDAGKQNEKGYWNLDLVTVLPPIAHPTKIICMGGNFSDHLAEGSSSLPPFPISFLKSPTSLVGHRAPVIYPRNVKLLDYEVELATVIGKKCKDVSQEDALQFVAGLSVFNDDIGAGRHHNIRHSIRRSDLQETRQRTLPPQTGRWNRGEGRKPGTPPEFCRRRIASPRHSRVAKVQKPNLAYLEGPLLEPLRERSNQRSSGLASLLATSHVRVPAHLD